MKLTPPFFGSNFINNQFSPCIRSYEREKNPWIKYCISNDSMRW